MEKQLSVVSSQLPVPTLSPKQGDKGGAPARKFIQDRLQVLIPEYLTCKSCQINILRGDTQGIQNMGLASRRKCNGINILRGDVQNIKNMGLATRLKYNGLNILQAKY